MKRTASTLVAVAGILAGSAGQAFATGSWSEEPVPSSAMLGSLQAVGSAQGEAWAFGYTDDMGSPLGETSAVYRKGEQGWQPVPIENVGRLVDGAVVAPDDVWTISQPPKGGAGTAQRWDGQKWTRVDLAAPSGASPQPWAMKAFGPDDIWTVGSMWGERGMAQHWDGRTWTDVPVPEIDDKPWTLEDVEGVASDDLWAVGQTTSPYRSVAVHWDGAAWTAIPVPDGSGNPDDNEGLSSVFAVAPNDVWVSGYSGRVGHEIPFTAHWDGKAWKTVEIAGGSGTIHQFVQVGDQIQAFGTSTDGKAFALRWDGTTWQDATAPSTGRVYAATSQEDGSLLGVGSRMEDGSLFKPFAATYRE